MRRGSICILTAALPVALLSSQALGPEDAALIKEAGSKYPKNCMVCHQFYGMGGYLGPDLTNVVSRLGEETVAWVLRNGRGSMPDMDLTEEEISSLVVFFNEIGNTGVFPQQSWPPGWFPATEHSLTDK